MSGARYGYDTLPEHRTNPASRGRFVHGDAMTLAFWSFDAGTDLAMHEHPHEQVVNVLEGELELEVGGEIHRLREGDLLVIPGGIRHGGRTITKVRLLDVFTPVREDLRALDAAS